MGRLIDADKLDGYILTKHGESNKVMCSKSIADVPTAYDVEAVVKELEEYMDENKHETNSGFIEVCIDIVKRGGVK